VGEEVGKGARVRHDLAVPPLVLSACRV
jgi:hypothetical protein